MDRSSRPCAREFRYKRAVHFTVTRRPPGWVGWQEGAAPAPAPVVLRSGAHAWSVGARSEFTYRDLGLAGASGGAIGARHVRRVGAGAIGFDWHCHDADFQFNYVIAGSATVETEHGERHRLSPGDAICQPGLHRVRELDFSEDYECIQIAVPAEAMAPIVGLDAKLPPRARTLDPARRTVVSAGAGSRAEADGAAVTGVAAGPGCRRRQRRAHRGRPRRRRGTGHVYDRGLLDARPRGRRDDRAGRRP